MWLSVCKLLVVVAGWCNNVFSLLSFIDVYKPLTIAPKKIQAEWCGRQKAKKALILYPSLDLYFLQCPFAASPT